MSEERLFQKKTILVVDDEPLNRKLVRRLLTHDGYQVVEAPDGKVALELAQSGPDLILLDIMMPVLDGIETCRRLKDDPVTRDIPVIFLSALPDADIKVTGFRVGGLDYISKPFNREELLSRIRTHLTLREQELRLRQYAEHLGQMVEERTCQLIHADRLATLGTLAAALGHEVKNHLQGMLLSAEFGQRKLKSIQELLSLLPGQDNKNRLFEEVGKVELAFTDIKGGGAQVGQIIKQLKGYGSRGNEARERVDLIEPIRDAVHLLGQSLKHLGEVIVNVPTGMTVLASRQRLSQVFTNLVANALDALDGNRVRIEILAQTLNDQEIGVEVRDNGPGIPPELESLVFEPFITSKGEKGGTGLGLFIVQTIIEEHQGCISLIPHEGPGTWFKIILPRPAA
jgi:C4-dicarboxylate-specific signal transduction histidine kinase